MPEFLGVGHQFVDEHHAGAAGVEKLLERGAARGDALFVGLLDDVEQPGIAGLDGKLIGHLAPNRVYGILGKVRRILFAGRVESRTNKNRHICFRQRLKSSSFHNRLQAGNMVNSNSSAHHVIERQHTVGFAAAECSFKLDNRFAALAGNPLERFY